MCRNSSELVVEEDVRYVELEIRRSDGTFGDISVDLNTVPGSAVSPTGTQEKNDIHTKNWAHLFHVLSR